MMKLIKRAQDSEIVRPKENLKLSHPFISMSEFRFLFLYGYLDQSYCSDNKHGKEYEIGQLHLGECSGDYWEKELGSYT